MREPWLDAPESPEPGEGADPDCGLCYGGGRVEDEDEDGGRLVDCPCIERLAIAREWAEEDYMKYEFVAVLRHRCPRGGQEAGTIVSVQRLPA